MFVVFHYARAGVANERNSHGICCVLVWLVYEFVLFPIIPIYVGAVLSNDIVFCFFLFCVVFLSTKPSGTVIPNALYALRPM